MNVNIKCFIFFSNNITVWQLTSQIFELSNHKPIYLNYIYKPKLLFIYSNYQLAFKTKTPSRKGCQVQVLVIPQLKR